MKTVKSDGTTASYYELPAGCTQLQDLISYRNLNAQDGEMFRAIYRKGMASHSDELRDARKVLYYAQAEVDRLLKLQSSNAQEWPSEDRIDAIGRNGGDPHYDELNMSDPKNWRVGDALKFMDVDCELYTQYDVYQILDIEGSTMKILCDKDASGLIFSTWSMGDLDCFQWHSRPSPEQ